MRLRFWFVASILLNLALLAAWYIAHIQEAQYPFIRSPRPNLAPKANNPALPGVRYINITWAQIESTNLAAYVANLRAVGCPAGTIRDIVLAEVNQSFARRRATEVLTPDQQWWKTEPDSAATRSANTQLRLLESARRSLLGSLLGPTWETETDVSAWIESNYGLTGPHLGTLPPETKQALYDLAVRTQEAVAGQNSADAARAYQSERAGLRAWLTPVAMNEYLLRYSPSAAQLRADTRGVNYSPEQFQALFAAIDPDPSFNRNFITGAATPVWPPASAPSRGNTTPPCNKRWARIPTAPSGSTRTRFTLPPPPPPSRRAFPPRPS